MENIPLAVWHVLLVDDDEDDYRLTRSMLGEAQGRKIELDWAPTYAEAEKLLQTRQYQAVLVDYDLGPRTGIDLIRETVIGGYPAPLILYTGRGSYAVDVEAMEAGATLYITKSEATPLLLERSLRYAIERRRIEEELDRRLQERSDILESIQDCFIALDSDWRITYINHHASSEAGSEPGDLIGRNMWEVYPRLHNSLLEENCQRVLQSRAPLQFEMHGAYLGHWYNISLYPSADGVSIYWQDISHRKQAEAELQRSEALYRLIARFIPDGAVFVIDRDLRYQVVEGMALERIGLKRDAMEGRTIHEVLDEQARQVVAERCRRVLAGEALSVEATYHDRIFWIQYAPLRDDSGQVIAVMALTFDITGRKQVEATLRSRENELQLIIDAEPALISYIDSDFCYRRVNAAYERWFGRATGLLQGHYVWEVLGEAAWQAVRPHMERALAGELVTYEQELPYEGSGPRWVHVTYTPDRDEAGQVCGFVVHVVDIGEQKRAEAALHAYAEQLRRSNQALQDFAFVASHDMQEPLRKIKSFGDLLKEHYLPALDETGRDYIERMQQAAGRIQNMIDGLLAYSQVTTQGQPFVQVDLHQVAVEVLSDLEVRLLQTGGQVTLDQLPVIEADPLQIRQLLQNLIGNALKFHRPGVPPQVTVSCPPGGNDSLELVVADNGIGFDVGRAGMLFQPFRRLHARSDYPGTGMGLAICRKIAERHGGSISVTSSPGQGATFHVRLRCRREDGETWGPGDEGRAVPS